MRIPCNCSIRLVCAIRVSGGGAMPINDIALLEQLAVLASLPDATIEDLARLRVVTRYAMRTEYESLIYYLIVHSDDSGENRARARKVLDLLTVAHALSGEDVPDWCQSEHSTLSGEAFLLSRRLGVDLDDVRSRMCLPTFEELSAKERRRLRGWLRFSYPRLDEFQHWMERREGTELAKMLA